MTSGVTNTGKIRILELAFTNEQSDSSPTTAPFYIALTTSAASFDAETSAFDTSTEIVSGNGYTAGGEEIAGDTSGFDALLIDTASAYGRIQFKDLVWNADTGGSIPGSGDGAFYAVLTDTSATLGSREVYAWFDLTSARTIQSGGSLTLQDIEIRLT